MKTMTKDLGISIGFDAYPPRHTCKGEDLSPALEIRGLTAPCFAIVLEDPDAPEDPYYHWVIWNIDARNAVPEGISTTERPPELLGAVQGSNTGGTIGYSGPCPPRGSVHRYFLRVFGQSRRLDLPSGSGGAELLEALDGVAIQYGEAMAKYGR